MKRAPLQERKPQNSSISSIISLRSSSDSLSIQFYTDNLISTLNNYKSIESSYLRILKPSLNRLQMIDWLINIQTKLAFVDETLFLAVNIIDRILSVKTLDDYKLVLLCVSSLFLAAKYEEVVPPCLETFVVLLEKKEMGDCESEIKKAERYILYALNYDLGYPSPLNFLRHISKSDGYNDFHRIVAKYLLEISLLFVEFAIFRGSLKAAACFFLARKICEYNECEKLFWFYADVDKNDVKEIVELYCKLMRFGVNCEYLKRKYKCYNITEKIDAYFKNL
ncbi:G2/mitotic-specific cyclin [Gurleya vavrai]